MNLRYLLILSGIAINGCSTSTSINDARIGSLKAKPLPDTQKTSGADHRAEAMQNYQTFLSSNPDNRFAPEALRRLADLNMEDEQTRLIEGDQNQISSSATELYKNLLTTHPDHENNDSATYQLARAYEQQGDNESVFRILTEYTQKYPDSENIDEAHFRIGEHLFSLGKFNQAKISYEQVTSNHSDSDFYQPSLYKSGWSKFKLNDIESALITFIQILDENIPDHKSSILPSSMGRAEQERLQDTLRVIGLSFSYLGSADIVENYFSTHGRKEFEPLVYASVAELHLSKQRYTDAADTYQRFTKTHPDHREAPLFQSHVISVYQDAGFDERVLEEKESFVKSYLPGSHYWLKHDIEQSPDVISLVKTYIDDITNYYHALAQEQKTPDSYQTAVSWYKIYFQGFQEHQDAPKTNFLFAELLLEAGHPQKAIEEYERTAYNYGQHTRAAEAGYAALLAHNKFENSLTIKEEKASWHRNGIDKALRFANTFPTHANAIIVKTRAAEQLYALNEHQLTIDTAESIVGTPNVQPDTLLTNWTIIAHSYFALSNYESAEKSYQQVLLLIDEQDDQKPTIIKRLAASIYKQGEAARNNNQLADAIKHFNRVSIVAPSSAIAATAGYDAATAYISLNQFTDAIKSLETWRNAYPDNSLNDEATNKLAHLYKETSQPLKAASEYERVALSNIDISKQGAALWSAATLYQDANQPLKAIDSLESYVNRFPVPESQALEARATLVKLHTENNNIIKSTYWHNDIISAYKASPALQNDRGRYLAATSQLALAKPHKNKYLSIRLIEPLQDNLMLKKKYLQAAIDAYTLSAQYNLAEISTQSTFEIGNIYADFSKAILDSERPAGLSGEELEQYNILLEDEAFPIEEQAIEIHEANMKHLANGHYNEWTRNSLEQLSALLPGRYKKTERVEKHVSP